MLKYTYNTLGRFILEKIADDIYIVEHRAFWAEYVTFYIRGSGLAMRVYTLDFRANYSYIMPAELLQKIREAEDDPVKAFNLLREYVQEQLLEERVGDLK